MTLDYQSVEAGKIYRVKASDGMRHVLILKKFENEYGFKNFNFLNLTKNKIIKNYLATILLSDFKLSRIK